jgi:CIC family chloride channel protein
LVVLCLVKIVATIVSYVSGNAGGIFAPSLYIGAMAGGAVGSIVHDLAPLHTADPGAYALVGMGTLFAGIIRAPMTSVFMIFEITQDYQILVPLMVANLLSFVISRRFQPEPLYHALLRQDGVHLPTPGVSGGAWTAGDVMTTDTMTARADLSIDEARIYANGRRALVVVDTADRLLGAVTVDQLSAAVVDGRAADPIGSIVVGAIHLHPDHPSELVVERLTRASGALLVVDRADAQNVRGVVTHQAVVEFLHRRDGRAASGSRRTNHRSGTSPG